jgi:phosphatidate cytidylyltransferase
MLRTRIITALVLLSAFFFALFYLPPPGWVIFATLTAAVAAWEWGTLMALQRNARFVLAVAFILICAALGILEPAALGLAAGFPEAAWRIGRWFYVPAAVFWLLAAPLWMKCGWPLPKSAFGLAIGLLVILPPWLGLVQLRQAGALTLLAVMAIVWLADIAAYVFGRRFGKHKLAPRISPGKTWEGALGAACAVIVYGFVLSPKLPPILGENYALLFVALVVVTAIGIIGDLFESLLKRQAGLKDSSNFLPGHGGVLDRIDSLTSTLPFVALVWLSPWY